VAPTPVTAIDIVGFDALLVKVTVPFRVPATVGVNATVKVALCPALSVKGSVRPLML
jgi:hypothetical protein